MDCHKAFLFTCEHASRRLPKNITPPHLDEHMFYDIGAYSYARILATRMNSPLIAGKWSRLLVDLNRSPHHPKLSYLFPHNKKMLIERYYMPFRMKTYQTICDLLHSYTQVIHISCHSFTPIFHGQQRDFDIGLLYDPSRKEEQHHAHIMSLHLPPLRVRYNAPYKGTADGHVTHLRKQFSPHEYIGLELEVNQENFTTAKSQFWQYVGIDRIIRSLLVLHEV